MKRFIFSVLTLGAIVACSDDDGPKETCNCQYITATYNEQMQAYETIDSEYYSNDCSDETNVFNEVGDGTFYRINCTPQD